MAEDDIKSFDVAFECDATAVGKMRCEMDVRLMVPEVIEWQMASTGRPPCRSPISSPG